MPPAYVYRPATLDDVDAFYALFRTEHLESYGNFGMTREEVAAEWDFPGFDLAQHTMNAFTEDGQMVAFAELRTWRTPPIRPILYAYVHPDHRRQGIGTAITQWGIQQASCFLPLVPEKARVVLGAFSNMEDGQRLLENNGFHCTRQSHLMSIDLHDGIPKPQFPDGFRLVTMAEHPVLEDFVRVYQETFKDHRGAVDEPLQAAVDRWERVIASGDFPPENFVLVKAGDTDAAIIIMANKSDDDPDKLFVQTLGTMPVYRGRGLATHLLYFAFQKAWEIGKPRVGLSVDASSLTGANRLYAKVGMKVDMVYNAYELEIRPGIELSKQA
ncbi:MAG: GNAT family N-acetyltransferase [Anaerolineaceae bacterium]|nr:GNAT family N-acetyltransferase [Anaerolineaceae bacterium]